MSKQCRRQDRFCKEVLPSWVGSEPSFLGRKVWNNSNARPNLHETSRPSTFISSQRQPLIQFMATEQPPLISERTALLCGLLFTAFFVAPFYLSPTLRTSSLNSRDSPTVIKARVRAVALTCLASTVVAVYVLVSYGHASPRDVLRLFAVWPINLIDCAKTLCLLAVLFVGPLYESIIVDGIWTEWSFAYIADKFFADLRCFRNHVVAPWAEEWVFRSLFISLYLLAKVSPTRIVFLTPIVFGAAHIHHIFEFVRDNSKPGRNIPFGKVLLIGIARSFFQFAYTSLFGFFAAFVYLRTGNVFATITAHTFCNIMGFPRVTGKVGQHADDYAADVTPDVAQGKRDDTIDKATAQAASPTGPRNLGVGWSVVYYCLMLAGSYGFYTLLWPLTESPNALSKF